MPDLLLATINFGRLVVRRTGTWQRRWSHQLRRWAKSARGAVKAVRAVTVSTVKAGRHAASLTRLSALHKNEVQTRALLKLSANLRLHRDRFALSSLENHLVRRSAGMQCPVWISPQSLLHSVRQMTPANVVTVADHPRLVRPVSGESTVNFIDEIVRQSRPYIETTLFKEIVNGKRIRKRLGHETVLLTASNFRHYYDRCVRHVELVAGQGLRPWNKSAALSYDGDIAVLLSSHGELMFLRRGTHRLGIARALGLPRIPVQIVMVAGGYLAASAEDPGWYLPWGLATVIRRAVDRTLALQEGARS